MHAIAFTRAYFFDHRFSHYCLDVRSPHSYPTPLHVLAHPTRAPESPQTLRHNRTHTHITKT